jgi:hypothetical protein
VTQRNADWQRSNDIVGKSLPSLANALLAPKPYQGKK